VLLAPRGTPQPIIAKVSADLAQINNDPAYRAKLGNVGSYTRAMTPAQVVAFVKKEQATWLPLRKAIGK
jgi:tripartite-type tricarboxylate transporter receptor subunit TctC